MRTAAAVRGCVCVARCLQLMKERSAAFLSLELGACPPSHAPSHTPSHAIESQGQRRCVRHPAAATRQDIMAEGQPQKSSWIGQVQDPVATLSPVAGVLLLAAMKLHASGLTIA